MSAERATAERPSLARLLGDLVLRNWGLKAIAFVLAALMFVFTRDEVTRGFVVPLRVDADPERVLLTELPETIQVQARGPWTRINRLQDYDFGAATLDLKAAKPGPLEIDRAGIVMPPGVILAGIKYDPIDLRFDPVIKRDVPIEAEVVGAVAPDYELVRVEVQPTRWWILGGESFVQKVQQLRTEPLALEAVDHDVETQVALVRPPEGVTLVDAPPGGAVVTVRAIVNPRQHSRAITVPVVVAAELDPTGAVPRTYEVRISGPVPDFRVLDSLGVSVPVQAEVVELEGEGKGGGVVEVRFVWVSQVPDDLRQRLALDHTAERVELPTPPTPPPPPPTLDLPVPE